MYVFIVQFGGIVQALTLSSSNAHLMSVFQ